MRTHLSVGFVLLLGSLAQAQTNAPQASVEAAGYLQAALEHIEKSSRVYTGDWEALRKTAQKAIAAAGAKTTADTYPAIRDMLRTLGDKHALLLDPVAAKLYSKKRGAEATGLLVVPPDGGVALVLPNSPAAAAGLALGDRIVAVEGVAALAELPPSEFMRLFRSGQRQDGSTGPLELRVKTGTAEPRAVKVGLAAFDEYLAPTGRRLDGGVGYLELPGVVSGPKAATYDDAVHEVLGRIDDGTLRGCIVDLRRNTGGTLWPMLAGIGPLAGAGKLGAFVSAHSGAVMSYDAELGAAKSEGYELARVDKPHPLRDTLPVAVLTGPLTTHLGEAVVVAFAGRAHTRRFGEGTRGMPIGNTSIKLADGALLVLTVTVDADRNGTRYDTVIPPDEVVATDWARFGAADDPVVVAACRWLAGAAGAK
ncbi:MAG: hypothetical protein IPJ77_21350 [Planctomycetes bacterium]|nr:hypothetical protein [Planctomycetota bacterium]